VGFKPEATIYSLNWEEGHKFHGLQMAVRACSVRKFTELIALAGTAADLKAKDTADITAEDIKGVENLFSTFAGRLVSWNVDGDDGQPVPPTLAGVMSQEVPFVLELIEQWMGAMGDVAPPLPAASGNGHSTATKPLMEASLPMAASSASPGN
jgi:hypothetical protein